MAKDLKIKITSDSSEATRGIKKVTDEVHGLGSAADQRKEKVNGLDNGLDGLDSSKTKQGISSIKTGLTAAGVVAAAVYVTIKKVVSTAQEYVELYAAQAKAEASVAAAIRATGQEAEFTIGNLREQASALQAVTVYGDETILTLQQLMVQTGKIGSDIMPAATEAALDMSAALGTGIQENAKKLARALADPEAGITLLKESMINFSPEQQKMIKNFVEQGNTVSAQKVILDQLSASYGGLARAQASVSTAKIEQISNLMGDIKEGLGQGIITGLTPAMDWLLEKLGVVNDKIAQANRLSGATPASSMSDTELSVTWELKRDELETLSAEKEAAQKLGGNTGYVARVQADKAYADALAVYNSLNDEINRRAQEAGWKSATAYAQAYIEQMEEQRLSNPITPDDEKESMRISGVGVPGTTVAENASMIQEKANSAREKTLELVQQTEGYQRMQIGLRIEELEALKAQNEEEMKRVSHNDVLLQKYQSSNALIDEQLGLYRDMLAGQSDISKFIETNAWYARETATQEKDRLETSLKTAQAMLLQKDVTKEEAENIQSIITGLEQALEQLKPDPEPSEISQFMEDNASYAKETAEQEKARLDAALATAEAYLLQKDLTEEQRKNIEAIIVGLKQAQGSGDSGEKPSYYEQLKANSNLVPPKGSWKDYVLEGKEAAEAVSQFMKDEFGDIMNFGVSFYKTMIDAQKKASEAQIKALEKQIAAEKKLYEKQTDVINNQYEERTQSLADKYAWGLMTYEEYISAQQALDDEKADMEEAAAERFEKLEADKAAITNKLAKTEFENNKKQSMAEALIGGSLAAINALKLGPIFGPIAAAIIAGLVAVQVGTIASQQYTPTTALAEGGIAYRPTTALIGEGGEPEMVLPLSKAQDMGFGGGTSSQTTIVNMNGTFLSVDDLSALIAEGIARGQRTGRIQRTVL